MIWLLLLRFRRVNKIYQENVHRSGIEFIDSLIEHLGIRYEISQDELDKIPREGAFITVSNHPFGGIDGLLLIKLIASIRPDYKVLPNFLLARMEPVYDFIFKFNSPGKSALGHSSFPGLDEALSHLRGGSLPLLA